MKFSIINRSIVAGHNTGASFEDAFWDDLRQIAKCDEAKARVLLPLTATRTLRKLPVPRCPSDRMGARRPDRNSVQRSSRFPAQSVRNHQDECDRHQGRREGDDP